MKFCSFQRTCLKTNGGNEKGLFNQDALNN